MAIKFEITNRFTGAVQFTAEIDCAEDVPSRVKIGLAVKWAIKTGANLRDADLSGADLRGANLRFANLGGANLRGANLSGANLSDADLSGANLSGANLRFADLSDANLGGANLSGANLRGADLSDADLSGANLRGANLSDADLSGANLRFADLSDADLSDADLSGANLSGANLSDAYLSDADLRSFKSDLWMILTMAQHEVPFLVEALKKGRVNGSTYEGECACLVGTLEKAPGAKCDLPRESASPAEQWFAMISPGDTPDKDTGGGSAAKMALEWIAEWQSFHAAEEAA